MLCWSDVHGRLDMFEKFLNYKPEEEHGILGDISHSRYDGVTYQDVLKCWDLLIKTNTKYVWGNHDLDHINGVPNKTGDYWRGEHPELENLLNNLAMDYPVAMVRDGYLLTHAGVHPELAIWDLAQAESNFLNVEWMDFLNMKAVPEPLSPYTQTHRRRVPQIFYVDFCRGGRDGHGGITWRDDRMEEISINYPQVYGHTTSDEIVVHNTNGILSVCVDNRVGKCFNTKTHKVEIFI